MTNLAIIFDMDGLMFDTEKLAFDAWKQAVKHFSCELDEGTFYSLVGKAIPVIESSLAEALGASFDLKTARKLKQKYFEENILNMGIPLKPGLLELLDYLEQKDISKAVASSTDKNSVIQRLSIAEVLERFDTIVGGDEIQNGKPSPDIFLETANLLGVPPEKCIVLEDSDVGIKAAVAAGMYAIMIPDKKEPDFEAGKIANKIFSSLHDVIQFLDEDSILSNKL